MDGTGGAVDLELEEEASEVEGVERVRGIEDC